MKSNIELLPQGWEYWPSDTDGTLTVRYKGDGEQEVTFNRKEIVLYLVTHKHIEGYDHECVHFRKDGTLCHWSLDCYMRDIFQGLMALEIVQDYEAKFEQSGKKESAFFLNDFLDQLDRIYGKGDLPL